MLIEDWSSLFRRLEASESPMSAVALWLAEQPRVSAAAILVPDPPTWKPFAAAPQQFLPWPVALAAEAAESNRIEKLGEWLAVPLPGSASRVVVLRARDTTINEALAAQLQAVVDHAEWLTRQLSESQQSQTLLTIISQWRRTDDLPALLEHMAEAATKLFDCDRATIFLWDRTNKTLVGRPALGLPNRELRIPDNVGVVGRVLASGEALRVNIDDNHAAIYTGVDKTSGYRTESLLCVPLATFVGERLGAFELINKRGGRFTSNDQTGLAELARHAAVALAETQEWTRMLAQNQQLVEATSQVDFVGDCASIESLRRTIRAVADTELAVLLLGENGTGKEVVAQCLHNASRRRLAPFLAVNCAALTETLLESELFGHEKGAFTDAHATRVGKFEAASGGTILLDEIGDMSLAGQAKLLRVLEEKVIVRVGGTANIETDVRVVAATNRNLPALVRDKRFREDLYYRLNVVSIEMPALRDRGDDIVLLADHFLTHFCRKQGRRTPELTAAARKRLLAHRWPGNVRELRNLMERLAYLSDGNRIDADDLAFVLSPGASDDWFHGSEPLQDATKEFQIKYINRTIERLRGNVTEAAKALGLHRSNLYRKMKQLGMSTDDDAGDGEP